MRDKSRLIILGAAFLQLVGCSSVPNAVNPISWYRDLTGASKNDELGKDENQKNLQEGSNEPYPNLANVPAAPDTALSTIDRDKLQNSLIADRNNAQYSGEDLRPGRTTVTAPPPAPPSRPQPAASAPTPQAPSATPAPPPPSVAATTPPPPPEARTPPAAPAKESVASAPAQPPPTAPQAQPPRTQQRLPQRGSEAPPAESKVVSPQVRSVPQGEPVTPVPPPPQIPSSAPSQPQPPSGKPASAPSAAPQLKAPKAPEAEAALPPGASAASKPHRPAISYRVADVAFAPGSALLPEKLRSTIDAVVKLHGENGGTIRIVGHGEASGSNAAVAGFTLALDRAQAVAVALTERGVAAKDIAVEAAPVAAKGGKDVPRAEVYLEN